MEGEHSRLRTRSVQTDDLDSEHLKEPPHQMLREKKLRKVGITPFPVPAIISESSPRESFTCGQIMQTTYGLQREILTHESREAKWKGCHFQATKPNLAEGEVHRRDFLMVV